MKREICPICGEEEFVEDALGGQCWNDECKWYPTSFPYDEEDLNEEREEWRKKKQL